MWQEIWLLSYKLLIYYLTTKNEELRAKRHGKDVSVRTICLPGQQQGSSNKLHWYDQESIVKFLFLPHHSNSLLGPYCWPANNRSSSSFKESFAIFPSASVLQFFFSFASFLIPAFLMPLCMERVPRATSHSGKLVKAQIWIAWDQKGETIVS